MKKMVHRGWLYVASVALSVLGLVAISYTASAQNLWVLGKKIDNPLNNSASESHSGYDLESEENWNGYWSWDHKTKILHVKNLESNMDVRSFYAVDIPDFKIEIEGSCTLEGAESTFSAIACLGKPSSPFRIMGKGEKAYLTIEITREGSTGILIGNKKDMYVDNCYVQIATAYYGIRGERDGSEVGIRLQNGGEIDVWSTQPSITSIGDYIEVEEDGDWVDINKSTTYALTALHPERPLKYERGSIVYASGDDAGTAVKSHWVMLSPYYPIRIGNLKLRRARVILTPEKYSTVITSGSVEYDAKNHSLTLDNAAIPNGVVSYHPSKPLTVKCKGANKVGVIPGNAAITTKDHSSPTIMGITERASLKIYPAMMNNMFLPGICDDTKKGDLLIKDVDLEVENYARSCICATGGNKRMVLKNLNAELSTKGVLIEGFKTLVIEDAYIAMPFGAVVKDGTIKLNGEPLKDVRCRIQKGKAPTFAVTAQTPQNGKIKIKGYGDLKNVPYNTELTVEVTPNQGYMLDKLTANSLDITATKKFFVERATTVKATFKKDTALEDIASTEVLLYPNPTEETTTLSGVEPGAMVQVFSIDGVEVLRIVADEAGVARLDLAGVVAGKYFVKSGKTTMVLLVTK